MAPKTGYLRIGELARRTGTSPELLRAWEQRYGLLTPSRSAGGFRLYSDEDVARVRRVRSLIADGLSAAEAASRVLAMRESGEPVALPVPADARDDLQAALDAMDGHRAHLAFDRLLSALSVETVLGDVLLPYLRRLGERWASGEITVAQEHFASNLIRGRLLGLARGWDVGLGPSVVLACPPGEGHELGLIIFGIAIAERGWRVIFLGADTPFETLEDVVRSFEPAMVVMSVSKSWQTQDGAALARITAVVPVAVGGELSADDAARLGVSVLDGDPLEAARTVASSPLPRTS
jgi:MerR family transcriptional regulator, light-induced transcriptional regulator